MMGGNTWRDYLLLLPVVTFCCATYLSQQNWRNLDILIILRFFSAYTRDKADTHTHAYARTE